MIARYRHLRAGCSAVREAVELYLEDQPFPEQPPHPVLMPFDISSRLREPAQAAPIQQRDDQPAGTGGFMAVSIRGSHCKLRDGAGTIVIVRLHRDPLRPGTQSSILAQAGVSLPDD
jgi:predicted RNA binding protein YcfA (HicA-like mRNA interferase family)